MEINEENINDCGRESEGGERIEMLKRMEHDWA